MFVRRWGCRTSPQATDHASWGEPGRSGVEVTLFGNARGAPGGRPVVRNGALVVAGRRSAGPPTDGPGSFRSRAVAPGPHQISDVVEQPSGQRILSIAHAELDENI